MTRSPFLTVLAILLACREAETLPIVNETATIMQPTYGRPKRLIRTRLVPRPVTEKACARALEFFGQGDIADVSATMKFNTTLQLFVNMFDVAEIREYELVPPGTS